MKPKTLAILVVIAVIAVIAAAVALRSGKPATDVSDGAASPALFADLSARVNDVAAVSVRTPTSESVVERVDDKWTLRQKSGYPVDAAKVREVILSLAALKNFTPKTARAEGYKALGVEDVAAKPADTDAANTAATAEAPRGLLLTLSDKAGQPITSVIVGNTRWPTSSGIAGGTGTQGVYLRRPSDATSYLADGKLDVPREPINWVNSEFADIARDRVRSVTLTPHFSAGPETDRIVVERDKPTDAAFVVRNIPEGKQLKDPALSETLVSGLVKTTFEDVAKAETISFAGGDSSQPGPTAEVRTWDGLIVRVETVKVGDRHWWRLTPSADPDPYLEAPPPPPPAAPPADGSAPPPPPPPADPKPRRTPEEVKKEVDELAARWSGWAYSPFSYKASAFTKKLSEELKDPAPPAPPPTPAPAPVPVAPPSDAPTPATPAGEAPPSQP